MSKIVLNAVEYQIHPNYDLYASDKDGNVINIIKKVPHKGNKDHSRYQCCSVRKYQQKGQKAYQVHRFVWECFNGIIPEGRVIDHINNNKEDNRLCNLQLTTQQQNCEKSAKDRDYTFAAKNHENKKCVKSTNSNTKEVSYYKSMYAVQQHLGINAGIVKMVCEGLNNCKTGISKKDGQNYKFEYVREENMPDDCIQSSKTGAIRQRLLNVEDKKKQQKEAIKRWQNKEFICKTCNKTFKNNYKYVHYKICR